MVTTTYTINLLDQVRINNLIPNTKYQIVESFCYNKTSLKTFLGMVDASQNIKNRIITKTINRISIKTENIIPLKKW